MQEASYNITPIEAASQMALPVGALWTLSFLGSMYGTEQPLLSMLGSVLPLISVFILRRMLGGYRSLQHVSGMQVLYAALLTGLFAGLLTDLMQYAYFLFLDNGRLLTNVATAMESDEYRQALQQLMPGVSTAELQKEIQQITIRDIMLQLVVFNMLIALPYALLSGIAVRERKVRE